MSFGRWAMAWCAYLALYLIFTGNIGRQELAAGAVTASLALFLVIRLRRTFTRTLSIKPVWLIYLWRIPWAMLEESWLLLVAVLRRLAGQEQEGVFIEHHCPGCDYDRHDAARRAFMAFGVCITPNSYLVHYDPDRNNVLLRQLVGNELSRVDRLFVELP